MKDDLPIWEKVVTDHNPAQLAHGSAPWNPSMQSALCFCCGYEQLLYQEKAVRMLSRRKENWRVRAGKANGRFYKIRKHTLFLWQNCENGEE